MTRNPKPNELPTDIDDIPAVTAPLVIDQYLARPAVIDRIAAHTDADIDPATGRATLTRHELAAIYREHRPDDDDGPTLPTKPDVIQRLGDIFDFPASPDQDTLRKSQMVHVLLAVATDRDPDPFTLPSDPDDRGSTQPDAPTLSAGPD